MGAIGATVVFAAVARFAQRPIRLFRIIAAVVLLLSFVTPFTVPGASPWIIGTLLAMHVVAAVVIVGLLTTLTRPPDER